MDGAGRRAQPGVATIRNQRGLHARAAANFVKLASQFEAEIQVRRTAI